MADLEQLQTLAAPPETQDEEQAEPRPDSNDPLEGQTDLQDALLTLYLKCTAEDRYARLIEVKDVKQAENYWAGRQYEWWSSSEKTWKGPTQQAGSFGDIDVDDMPRFQFVTNNYQADGLAVIGAIAGAPPRIRFFPEDADQSKDLETAEGRTKEVKLIQRWNPPQLLLQQEAYHAWTGGFIAWWTRYVANGEKYGIDSIDVLSQSSVEMDATISCPKCNWSAPANQAEPPVPCPQCGTLLTEENVNEEESIPVPVDGGQSDVPRGRQVINVYGALNCKRPQHTNQQSQWHYFAIEDEIHYAILRGAFPDKAEKIKPGMNFGADDVFERNARLSLSENSKSAMQSAGAQANLVTFPVVWFRPSAFWMLDDNDKRDRLLEIFPRGCRAEFAATTYCNSEKESMDDAIVSTHAMPGRGQHRPAIGTSSLSVQDRLNTLSNIAMETYEYGIPITYRDSQTFDSEADADQRAAPGLEVEVFGLQNSDIRTKIMQVRADSVSPDMQQHMADLMGPVSQKLSGAFPALTGSSAKGEQPETLGQQGMQHDQAMGRMGVFYVPLKQAHADLMTISCRSLEAHTNGVLKIPVLGPSGDFESESIDVTALEGEAEAYPEGDENFPELWNQQRATMERIADTPYGMELMKEPGNAELFAKLTGIPDLKIPNLEAWRKQLKEIAELTKIPEGDDLLAGIGPMVEVDSDDFHDIESACCKWWLNSSPGQKKKRENPAGWMAVKEHKAKHDAMIPAPQQDEKPPTSGMTAAFKDLPPEAKAQWLEKEYGIKLDPQAFIQQIAFEHALKPAPKPAPGMPPQAGTPSERPANAVGG